MPAGISLEQLLIVPISLAAFVVLLSIIVFFHEFGHFSVARLLGVRVEVFSIGFGKPIARWRDPWGTEWRIAMIPLGGYVKFFGDLNSASQPDPSVVGDRTSGDEPHPATTQFPRPGREAEIGGRLTEAEKKVCFHLKPVWARAAIVAAGPLANFALAIAIFWGLFVTLGASTFEPVVGAVNEGSAAEAAGIAPGDRILSVNGRRIERFSDLQMTTRLGAGDELRFQIERNGETITVVAVPRRVETTDVLGNKVRLGQLGIAPDADTLRFVAYAPGEAFVEAVREVGKVLAGTMKYLGRLILGKEDASQLGGPIKMAKFAGQAAKFGFDDSRYPDGQEPDFVTAAKASLSLFVYLAAVVSISIGFLNLLPVPVLDGGHLMYYAYEAAAGRPLGVRAQAVGFRVGLVLLASLMLFVTWNDISNLITQ